jgi:hypothetical protein
MIAAVSPAVPAVRTATKAKTGWAFQPLPNLNRETRQRLGTTRAGWTFSVICTELGYAVHKGRATWDKQRLGIGLRALARESGQSLGKVRRDVAALGKLGLVVIHRHKVMHVADPVTGKITSKSRGRCESTLIYLTITESVLRPAKVHRGTTPVTTVAPPPDSSKVHRGTTVTDSGKQRTPDGGADGVGTPLAGEAAGLPAGGNRLPPPAEAAPVIPAEAGRDEPPLPDGRITPQPQQPGERRWKPSAGHHGTQEGRSAADAAADWHRGANDPEKAKVRAEYLAARARKAAPPPPPDRRPESSPNYEATELAKADVLAVLKMMVT